MAQPTPPPAEDIVLALQFWEGDKNPSLRLARAIADLEPEFNRQALFLFVHAFDCAPPPEEVVEHVRKKFRTLVVKSTTPWTGYPDGCAALWLDCIDWAREAKRTGLTSAECMLTFEFDCSPLVPDWIAKLVDTFRRVNPKAVMGDHHPFTAPGKPKGFGHINGNLVVSLKSDKVLEQIGSYRHRHKPKAPWDVVIYEDLYRIGSASVIEIQSDYRARNLRPSYLAGLVQQGVIFHHGCKDTSVIDFVSGNIPEAPRFTPDKPVPGLHYFDDTRPSVFAQHPGGLVEFPGPLVENGIVFAKHNGSLSDHRLRGHVLAYRATVSEPGKAPQPPSIYVADYSLGKAKPLGGVEGLERWPVHLGWENGYADPRLFQSRGDTYMAYSHWGLVGGKVVACNQRLCRLKDSLTVVDKNVPLPFFNNHPKEGLFEKNWSFFDDGGRIFAVYSILPAHVVIDTMTGRTIRSSSFGGAAHWERLYGQPRGGTPPIPCPGGWMSLFHSSVEEPFPTRRYFVGAYRFSQKGSNYQPAAFTRSPLLEGSLRDGLPWKPTESPESPAVIFPGSAHLSDDGKSLEVFSGLNEHSVAWHSLPVEKIFQEMRLRR